MLLRSGAPFRIPLVLAALLACGGEPTGPLSGPPPPAVPTEMTLPDSAQLRTGNTLQLTPRLRDDEGREVTGMPLTWRTSASTVASVSPTGLVVGRGAGTAHVTATFRTLERTIVVVVRGNTPTSVDRVMGDQGVAETGAAVPGTRSFRILDQFHQPLPGVAVTLVVDQGEGRLDGPAQVFSDDAGVVTLPPWRLGHYPGRNTVMALPPLVNPVVFEARARVTRQIANRPDERGGSLVRFFYALPADGADRGLDTLGMLHASVLVFQRFLRERTGGRQLRLDTFGNGTLDITFVRLRRSEAELAADGVPQRGIEADLRSMGLLHADRVYGVFYDGGGGTACGNAAASPAAGQVAAIYLRGHFVTNGAAACPGLDLMAQVVTDGPRYWDVTMLHEIFHLFGLVGRDAPHHLASRPGHVGDPNDLMYGGSASWTPTVIDAGGDDYAGMKVKAGLPNLFTSPFVERP